MLIEHISSNGPKKFSISQIYVRIALLINKEHIDYIVDNGTIPSEEVFEETSDESKIKTIDELKEIAKEKKIKNYSKMSKTELEEAIKESGEK